MGPRVTLSVIVATLLFVACGGNEDNTTANNTTANNTTANNTTANNTTAANNEPAELNFPAMPTTGEVVAVLTFEGETVTVVCDASMGGQWQAMLANGGLVFNTRNHAMLCDSQGTNFSFLNTPLDDTTDLPDAVGTTPVDVEFEFGGVATRRSVHDATAHSLTVVSGKDTGALVASFGAVWPDAEMYVWFNEPAFRRF